MPGTQEVEKPMGFLLFVLLGGVFLFCVLSILRRIFNPKIRPQELGGLAGQLGLEFAEQGSLAILNRDRFILFNLGREWRYCNILRGTVDGVRVAVFDYQFTMGTFRTQRTFHQTVCAVLDEKLDLPRFELKPIGFSHNLEDLFGYQDIDIIENTEFSREYVLRAESEDAIRAAFTPDVLSFFEARPGLNVEGGGDAIIFFRAGQQLEADAIQDFLMEGIRGLMVFRGKGS